jgi:hypothetical protein
VCGMVNTQNLAPNTSFLYAPCMFAIYFAPCAFDMFNFRKSSTQNPNKRQKHPLYYASLYFATPPSERPISYTIRPAARAAAALQIPLMSNKCAGRWTSTSNIKLNKKYIGMLWKRKKTCMSAAIECQSMDLNSSQSVHTMTQSLWRTASVMLRTSAERLTREIEHVPE